MPHIESILKISEQGVSRPFLCRDEFDSEHLLRDYRHAISADEVSALKERVRRLAQGEFLNQIWGEMPPEWTDVGESVLPLEMIRRVITEACDG